MSNLPYPVVFPPIVTSQADDHPIDPHGGRPVRNLVGSFLATLVIAGTGAVIASAVLDALIDRRADAQRAEFAKPDPILATLYARSQTEDAGAEDAAPMQSASSN